MIFAQTINLNQEVLATDSVGLREWIIVGGIILGTIVVVLISRQVLKVLERRTSMQEYVVNLIMRILTTVVVIVAVLYALKVLRIDIAPLLGGLTIFAVIIAYSLQPVLGNLIGAVTLHGSRPIKPGDQIDSNGIEGTVIDIHPRATEILTFDGVTVHVPNLHILSQPLTNRTADFERRTTLPFSVGFGNDLRDTQRVVEEAIRACDGVSDIPRADVLVEGFDESGVNLVARFWHGSDELFARWVVSEVAIAIQAALTEASIPLSYPNRNTHLEGSPPPQP